MATAWKVATGIAVGGWFVTPLIAFFMPKILARIGFDASEKLRHLELNILRELEETLQGLDEARIVERGRISGPQVIRLDKMAAMLRHAQEDAEDIFHDHQAIELYRNRWLQRLFVTSVHCCTWVSVWITRIVQCGSAWLLQCFKLPVLANEDQGASLRGVPPNEDQGASAQGGPANEDHGASLRHQGASLRGVPPNADPGSSAQGGPANEHQGASLQGVPPNADQGAAAQGGPTNADQGTSNQGGSDVSSDYLVDIPEALNKDSTIVGATSPSSSSYNFLKNSFRSIFTPSGSASQKQKVLVPGATPSGSASQEQALDPAVIPSVPVTAPAASRERVPANAYQVASGEGVPANEDQEASLQGVPVPSCISFDGFKNRCRCIIYWLPASYKKACLHRDLLHEGAGITTTQGGLDCVLTSISRRNLKKRIDKVESTLNEVKKSAASSIRQRTPDVSSEKKSTADVTSEKRSTPEVSSGKKSTPEVSSGKKSTQDDIVKEKRSEIRNASKHEVFGLKAFRDTIMAKLRKTPQSSSTSTCYSAIGIYGLSGSGKTTFAQYIRDHINEECKDEKLFDTIMCIQVSETFSVQEIFQNMLEDITKDQNPNISDLGELEKKLKNSLRGKRFFLILDDLWVDDKKNKKLQKLISVLIVGQKGSKILVTALNKEAAGVLCADKPDQMPVLDEDQYLSMLMHYALVDKSVVDPDFKRVGSDIAKRLDRSPIAAAIVAVRLAANRDIEDWENIAKLDMLSDTRTALWWSYQQFRPDIRRCFEYCNIFPKGVPLKKGDIVRLWTAQGFVKTINANNNMEDVAEGYIRELVKFSFLKHEKDQHGDDFYRIHDMLHDLVSSITGSDYFRIENAGSERAEDLEGDVPRDVRHLFVHKYDARLITEKKIHELENLRTLIIYVVEKDTPVEEKVIESICKNLPKLRVLAFAFSGKYYLIEGPKMFSLPASVSQLKHLCYLAFRTGRSCMVILPSTVNELQHIQVLDFGGGDIQDFTFAEHKHLRHIFCWSPMKLSAVVRLLSLQTLPGTRVSIEQGCELEQLGKLKKLRGKLMIYGLEIVKGKVEADKANLAKKEEIRDLILSWNKYGRKCTPAEVLSWENNNDTSQAEVLEGLCPPGRLEKLCILYYRGSKYPNWMMGEHMGTWMSLKVLTFSNCIQLGPPRLAENFPSLHELSIYNCSWDELPGNMKDLTSLKKLLIYSCWNIRSLPILPPFLEEFHLCFCDAKFTKSCQEADDPECKKLEHVPRKTIFSV